MKKVQKKNNNDEKMTSLQSWLDIPVAKSYKFSVTHVKDTNFK